MTEVLRLSAPLTGLRGIGPVLAARLAAQGLTTIADLLHFFPRRHQDVLELAAPEDAAAERFVRIFGTAEKTTRQWLPGRRSLVVVTFRARTGVPFQVPFFNQPYLAKAFPPGTERWIEGVLQRRGRHFAIRQPRVLGERTVVQGPVLVRYPELEGVSEPRLRGFLREVFARVDLAQLREELPPALAAGLPAPAPALRAMHFPASAAEHEAARRRFALTEAVRLFARIEAAQQRRRARRGPPCRIDAALRARIAARIPFALTGDQAAAIATLEQRLAGPAPMGVLLQGDVGSGKTAVAFWVALVAIANGYQVAFLAPTELLAEQHCAQARAWLQGSAVEIALWTGATATRALKGPGIAYGTHALFAQGTAFQNLGLVIVDEQHRFGVEQRMELVHKGRDPHVLVMTATPIPRTLALVLFGDLEHLTLRERPPGRRDVRGLFLDKKSWPRAVATLARHVRRGERGYVVAPKIEGPGGAVQVHGVLAKWFRAGLVHGELPPGARERELQAFRSGATDVLVGTTVLEVGVDVPEATLMVVLGAESFGLATLHQLRGRVGRGRKRGLCLLVGQANARIAAVCRTADGFALAEEDLRLRGPGELLGTRQSGAGDLRALDPIADQELLLLARECVRG